MKEARTGATGTSLLIIGGGVSWNSCGKFPEAGLSTRDSLSVEWRAAVAWLAWLTVGPHAP